MSCVNPNIKQFLELLRATLLSTNKLKDIIKKHWNKVGDDASYPTVEEVLDALKGETVEFGPNSYKLWEAKYQNPLTIKAEELDAYRKECQAFPSEAVSIYENLDGTWTVNIAEPNQIKSATNNVRFSSRNNIYENRTTDKIYSLVKFLKEATFNAIKENSTNRTTVDLSFVRLWNNTIWAKKYPSVTEGEINRDTALARAALIEFLKDNGLNEAIELIDTSKNNTIVKIHEELLADSIEESKRISDLFDNTEEAKLVLDILNFLKGRLGINYKVISEKEARNIIGNLSSETNAFVHKDTAFFIKGRKLTADIAAEEMLHPLVASIRKNNSAVFADLLSDARKLFPKLHLLIKEAYKVQEKFREGATDEELVTLALSRAFKEERKNNPEGNKFKVLIKKFSNWVMSLFSKHPTLNFENETITLNKLAALINSDAELSYEKINTLFRTNLQTEQVTQQEQTTLELLKDPKLQRIYKINEQFNNILNSRVLSSSDLSEVTDIIADLISDKINELANNRSDVKDLLTRRNPKNKIDVEALSRFELIKEVGIQHFLDLVKTDLLKNKRLASPENRAKITHVVKNWDYFISRAKGIVSEVEGIHLEVNPIGLSEILEDSNLVDLYDDEGKSILDLVEDGQLSWQVENNTIDPISSMTLLVKLRLRDLYVLKDTGRLDELGNPIYDRVKTLWGTEAKVGHTKAAKCLLRWISSEPSIDSMVRVLNEKAKKLPWVTLLIPILSDKTGKYTTELSLFFSVFYRPFMKFSNVGTKDGNIIVRPLNEHPFLSLAIKTIEANYKLQTAPIIANGLAKGALALTRHYNNIVELSKDFDNNRATIYNEIRAITKGFGFEIDVTELQLDEEEVEELKQELSTITRILNKNTHNPAYDPFSYKRGDLGIRSNIMNLFSKLTDNYEDTAVTSFFEGGKMRQSYLLPSFLSIFCNKFLLDEEQFNKFVEEEFDTEFMRDLSKPISLGWRNVWLGHMMSNARMRKAFKCHTNITFNGNTYMKGMTPEEYTLSMIAEFFAEKSRDSDSMFLANFRVPIESNKPSAEYITFYARGGITYKSDLITDFILVFGQELSRMLTVVLRRQAREASIAELKLKLKDGKITLQQYDDLEYRINQLAITNLDSRGDKFVYLDFLNSELPNEASKGTELGNLILDAINGKEVDKVVLESLAEKAIEAAILSRVDSMINNFLENGVFEKCKELEGFGKSDESVRLKLELMLWNDAFASTQIMLLLITDPAFLKDTDDVQKRFALVHSSGTRANLAATDFNGVQVSDGVHRSITLRDVKGFVSNIIDNLTTVLDRKINNEKNTPAEKIAWEALKEKLVGKNGLYRTEINLTDALAYSCPTSYRKKSFLFGLWDTDSEDAYNRIKEGNYTYSDVAKAFLPFKPFVYGNSIESTGLEGPMTKMRVPVQNKNAECLLVMADAIIGDEDTGRPNLLRALFLVMEDSHFETVDGKKVYKTDGIDTVNFESAVKSGGQGRINTEAYKGGREVTLEMQDGTTKVFNMSEEKAFKTLLESCIYNYQTVEGQSIRTYNRDTVKHLSYEYYCMLQSVPEHFLDHSQVEGSQLRTLIPSDLATVGEDGNPTIFKVGDNKMSAKELRERYDKAHSELILKGIQEINEIFKLENSTPRELREALSSLLVDLFLKDGRYSGDLLYMVTVNEETGDFPVSLEDPSIKNLVEQAINSIIKSRVNKVKMPGGPLVLMSNFGMSKELKIKFKDKDGNPLNISREDYNSDEEYLEDLKKKQGGIEHFEVIAPAYTEEIFREFMDKEGRVSIEALEALHPDLLKMIGYRIPTEDKYSIAPLKIVGFAPREMGDVIILPAEITLITGSDFDVDKENCIRKALNIIPNNISDAALTSRLTNSILESSTKVKYSTRLAVKTFVERFVNDPYNKKMWLSEGFTEAQYKDILKRYVNLKYSIPKTTGSNALRNEIFDLSYAVLTHESNVAKALKPGGFEEHKLLAYAVVAWRMPEMRLKYSFDELLEMNTKELGALIKQTGNNLIFLDSQVEYYDRNNSASSLLSISAVNSVAHALLVDDNLGINLMFHKLPNLAGFVFNQRNNSIRLDPSLAADGASVAETLGSNVAASADAAKDAVLNFMNLTPLTFNVYTTLLRVGVPNSTAALLMSSKVLADAISKSNSKNLLGDLTTPEGILREAVSTKALLELGYSKDSPIFSEEISREELIDGIVGEDDNVNIKIARMLVKLFGLSRTIRLADLVTRLNSTSSSVGPTTMDNFIFRSKLHKLSRESELIDFETMAPMNAGKLLAKHLMLLSFYEGYNLAETILEEGMPLTAAFLNSIPYIKTRPQAIRGAGAEGYGLPDIVKNDRDLMNKLRQFFTDWIAVHTGLIRPREIKIITQEFPKTIESKKREHKDNYLVQNLYPSVDSKTGFPIINVAKIDRNSLDLIRAAWAELYETDRKFALNLAKYGFFRGGLGFSPKTFMNLLPVLMKISLPNYILLFKNPPTLTEEEVNLMYKLFVSNNHRNNKLAPVKSAGIGSDGTINISSKSKNHKLYADLKYIKVRINNLYKLFECIRGDEAGLVYRTYKEIPKLGGEGNFIEVSSEDIKQSAFPSNMELAEAGERNMIPNVDDIEEARVRTEEEAREMLGKILSLNQQEDIKLGAQLLEEQRRAQFIFDTAMRLSDMLADQGYDNISMDTFTEMLNQLELC